MSAPACPTGDEVEAAIKSARKLLTKQAPYSRVELLAFMALGEAYPAAPKSMIAVQLGLEPDWDFADAVASAEAAKWFDEDLVNVIVGQLVASLYGEGRE